MSSVEKSRERLITLLKELFQLDQPELDFGLYKIMHAKSEQVTRFLDNDLLEEIEQAFGEKDSNDATQILEQAKARLKESLGESALDENGSLKSEFHELPAGKQYLQAIVDGEAAKENITAEDEVYDHLYRFFERYFDAGDFMSLRYYTRESKNRAAPYAIPYDGREIYLHWANKDQYYIKSGEYLTNYTFELNEAIRQEAKRQGEGELDLEAPSIQPLKVYFRIVGASESEHGNIKTGNDQKRFFIINETDPVSLENGKLVINFQYRSDSEKTGQDAKWQQTRLVEAETKVVQTLAANRDTEPFLKGIKLLAPTEKQRDRTLLGKHLQKYAARNTLDYFIHKDLGTFLRRELDFYIKNEIMRLDDIENSDVTQVENYLAKIRVLRRIANHLITFLAQLEEFQKKLWLKKKFITETQYCITLDRVPEIYYQEIATNEKQRHEWIELLAINEREGFSEPLSVEFLKSNQFMTLDTSHFGEEFKNKLVNELNAFDQQCDGVLVHADNFHGLQIIRNRYENSIKSVYLDPPYNTDVSAIPYKNSYRHSSWASLMQDRLRLTQNVMLDASACYVSIDKHERRSLEAAMDNAFGEQNKIEELIWIQNTNDGRSPTFSTNHEYVEVYSKNRLAAEGDYSLFREPKPGCEEVLQLISELNPEYPSTLDIQKEIRALLKNHENAYREQVENEGRNWEEEKRNDPWKGIYQYKYAEYRDRKGRFVPETKAAQNDARIWVYGEDNWTIMESDRKQSSTTKDPNHPNYRYYQPTHPETGQPCKMPSRGWKGTQFIDPVYPDRNSWESLMADHRIAFGVDENKVPRQKRFLHEVETNVAKSVIVDYADGEKETTNLFGRKGVFLAPKHTNFVSRFVLQSTKKGSSVLDIFGGSGSTAGAVINCNRIDELGRKYVLMEANEYLDTIIIPRLKKTIYASSWSDGKPKSHDGISNCFKYMRLESYEDALNNLVIREDDARANALQDNSSLRQEYLLNYFLDVETLGSQSLLNISDFQDPTSYKMWIKKPGSEEQSLQSIDLVETFNWLLGLRVSHLATPQSFSAEFEHEVDPDLPGETNTRLVCNRLKEDAAGTFWFRLVEGFTLKTPGDDSSRSDTLIIWRKQTDNPEQDNAALQKYLERIGISTREKAYDVIYVNGSHTLSNPIVEGEQTKVRLIEEAFHAAMWSGEIV